MGKWGILMVRNEFVRILINFFSVFSINVLWPLFLISKILWTKLNLKFFLSFSGRVLSLCFFQRLLNLLKMDLDWFRKVKTARLTKKMTFQNWLTEVAVYFDLKNNPEIATELTSNNNLPQTAQPHEIQNKNKSTNRSKR